MNTGAGRERPSDRIERIKVVLEGSDVSER